MHVIDKRPSPTEQLVRQLEPQSQSVSLRPPPPLPYSQSVSKQVDARSPDGKVTADEAGDAGAQWYAESTDAKLERIAGHIAKLGGAGGRARGVHPMLEGAH